MFFVFVDTQAFRKEAFDFERSTALVSLRNAVADRRITVLMTTITEREIKRLLASEITTAFQSLRKAVKDNYMLKTVPVLELEFLRTTRKEDVAQKAITMWEEFKKSIAPQFVDFNNVSPSDIMDAHFDEKPPFSAKKPNEFRDAFVLTALLDWAEAEDQQVLVVSADADHAAACDGTRLKQISKLDEAVAMCRDDAALEQQARDALMGQLDVVKEQLGEVFSEIPIAIEDDPDADAEDHSVGSIDVEPDDFVLIDFRDGYVLISGTITIHYSFTATINDYANGSRDEGDWVYLPHHTYVISSKVEARVAVRMRFGGAPARPGEADEVTIESPKRISLSLEDGDVDARVVRSWSDDADW